MSTYPTCGLRYPELTEDIVRHLYIEQKLNSHDIANIFGCTHATVLRRLHKQNLVRNRSESRMGIPKNIGERNGQWRGDDVGYSALHTRIRKQYPKPNLCENCGENEPYDVANKSGFYITDISDWKWLCRKCHMAQDGRLDNRDSGRFVKRLKV
jgi:hypothetical protein